MPTITKGVLHCTRHLDSGNPMLYSCYFSGGASTNALDHQHSTPLHEASESGHLDIVQQLVNFGARCKCPQLPGDPPTYHPPLPPQGILSDPRGSRCCTCCYFQQGASTNALDLWHSTALHEASENWFRSYVVQQLIQFGAADINAHNNSWGHSIAQGISIWATRCCTAVTPSRVSVRTLWISGIRHQYTKLRTVAHPDVVRQPYQLRVLISTPATRVGATPLNRAFRHRNFHIFQLLLELGADVNIRDEVNSTPLLEASAFGDLDFVRQTYQLRC